MDLVAKYWNFCHTLRHEGVDYSDYIEELTYLLFLKIADEKKIAVPQSCTWKTLISQDQETILKKYNDILTILSKQQDILGDIFRHPIAKIRNPTNLRKLLLLIEEEDWMSYDEDLLGGMFEGLLEKAANESKKGAGQYFTPRPLIETVVRVMKPNPFESPSFKISDVACGTAGFLISSFEWWKKQNKHMRALSGPKRKKLLENTYYGQELVLRPRRMAQMNMYLHNLSPSNIVLGDTIYDRLDLSLKFNCILTNPPFGTKGSNEIPERQDFLVKTSNKQLNFLQHIYSCLATGGRAAVVLPDSVLFEDKASDIWKHIMQDARVHTILRLPRGTFASYAQGVKANVIFLQKGQPTKETWIFDARTNIENVTKKGRPLSTIHFQEFETAYGEDANGTSNRKDKGANGRFRKFGIDEIRSRNYKLDINWLKEEIIDSDETISTEELLREAIDQVGGMLKGLKNMLNLLEK